MNGMSCPGADNVFAPWIPFSVIMSSMLYGENEGDNACYDDSWL